MVKNPITRYLLIAAGWISFILGVIGIVLPLLPTTPFMLLAAACFANSSPRFHDWLLSHKFFGPIIHNFRAGKGVPRRVRNNTIILIWVMMGISMLVIGKLWSTLLLATIGTMVSIYLLRLPTFDDSSTKAE